MRPVVRLERQDAQLGQLAVADLVRDLAGLHVALGVVARRLERRQAAERPGRELGVAADALHRHDQRVAPEQGHEPRHAGGRDEHALLERRVLELQRVHVELRLVPRAADGVVRRLEVDAAQSRQRSGPGAGRRPRCRPSVAGRRLEWVSGSQRRQVCQTPFGATCATKTNRPLANWGVLSDSIGNEDQLADEFAVDVRGPQLTRGSEPAGVDLATAHELAGLDVEDVGEVGLDLDLDRQPDRPPAVVDDVVVLVDAAGHGPVEPELEALAGDDAVTIEELGVGVLEPRRVELDGRGVEQERPLAVEEQLVAGHEPGVAGEEPLLGLAFDATVGLAHDEPVVPVHRDRRWPDLDREGHAAVHAGEVGRRARSATG